MRTRFSDHGSTLAWARPYYIGGRRVMNRLAGLGKFKFAPRLDQDGAPTWPPAIDVEVPFTHEGTRYMVKASLKLNEGHIATNWVFASGPEIQQPGGGRLGLGQPHVELLAQQEEAVAALLATGDVLLRTRNAASEAGLNPPASPDSWVGQADALKQAN